MMDIGIKKMFPFLNMDTSTESVSEWILFARMASGSVLLVGAGLTSSLTASLLAESLPGLSVPKLFANWEATDALTKGGGVGEGEGGGGQVRHF